MTPTYSVPRAVQGDAPERLAAWRKARDMSQVALAEELGCSQATLSMVEAGTRYPPEDVIVAAAQRCRIARSAWGERPKRRHAAKVGRNSDNRKLQGRSASTVPTGRA